MGNSSRRKNFINFLNLYNMENEFLLKVKISRKMLDEIFYKSRKFEDKWLVTNTISRFAVTMIGDRVILIKESMKDEYNPQVICVLKTAEDILLIFSILQRLDAIHDLVENEETGEVYEREFNISDRLSTYFADREEL